MSRNEQNEPEPPIGTWQAIRQFARRLVLGADGTSFRESLEEAIEDHVEEEGADPLGEDERSMLLNVLNYSELRIDDIMVPRVDIVALEVATPFDQLIARFASASHSRLPVYRDNLDDIIGMMHVKDVVIQLDKGPADHSSDAIESLMRPVLIVVPSMKLIDLLTSMRHKRTHMAIVVDEYGGTDGLVTIEDLVEQIVGDIEDEHDDESDLSLEPVSEGVYDASARLPVVDLERVLGCDLLPEERDEDIETLGGLVVSLEGRVPMIGEMIHHSDGYRFEVLDGDPRHITRIRIYNRDKA
jgi:hemolysin (HlyC) family protein